MSEVPLQKMGFWEHVDMLRNVLFRILIILLVFTALFFWAMPWLFDNIILAPCSPDFPLYRLLNGISADSPFWEAGMASDQPIRLINIQLASQFFIHMSTSFWCAVVVLFPVILYLLWGFVAPGLYPDEKKGIRKAFVFGIFMFYFGLAVGYFLVFPLTLKFLAEYQLSSAIPNQISLDSYMDNFLVLILVMGIIFELPLLAWLIGKTGAIDKNFFSRFRRHAIVFLLILAAVITPTGDPFTLMVVFLPVYGLWEFSRYLVSSSSPKNQ